MEYNDNLLCPELYEKMAKEYTKNIHEKSLKQDTNILTKLFPFFDILNNNLKFLNNLKSISPKNKQYLAIINTAFDDIKKSVENFEFSNQIIKSNYCECLTNSICSCANCIKEISGSNHSKKILNILNMLSCIIKNLSYMYGICKYRSA